MNNFKHLTKIELSEFISGSLETNESHEIGRHLLNCAVCREHLPMPSVERFRSVILTGSGVEEESFSEKTAYSSLFGLSFIPALFKQPSGWALSCCALLILICFSAVLWINNASSEREISQSFEFGNPAPDVRQNFPVPAKNSAFNDKLPADGLNPTVVPTQKQTQTDSAKRNLKSSAEKNLNSTIDLKNSNNINISLTRGVLPKCGNGQIIDTETYSENQTVILRWKKVPNAAKYHLYVSDENEILIDEFETSTETSYDLKSPLDSGKIYKWKLVVTLENGETVVGEAQEITAKDYSNKRERSGKVRNSAARCSDK